MFSVCWKIINLLAHLWVSKMFLIIIPIFGNKTFTAQIPKWVLTEQTADNLSLSYIYIYIYIYIYFFIRNIQIYNTSPVSFWNKKQTSVSNNTILTYHRSWHKLQNKPYNSRLTFQRLSNKWWDELSSWTQCLLVQNCIKKTKQINWKKQNKKEFN